MIRVIAWRPPSGRAFAVPAEPEVSALRASIPDAPPLTAADIRPVLQRAFPGRLTVQDIQNIVADFYGIQPKSMRDKDGTNGAREARMSHPRQVAMFFARKFTPMSYPAIARCFKRDHTTVMYAQRAVERRAESDPYFQLELEVLRERLAG
jgi:chromosomal replication initiator protein